MVKMAERRNPNRARTYRKTKLFSKWRFSTDTNGSQHLLLYVFFICVPLKQLKVHLKFTGNQSGSFYHLGNKNELNVQKSVAL